MIAVYAIVKLQAGKEGQFEEIAKPLIEASRKDKGCVSYNCGKVAGEDYTYTFVEQWQSQEDLQAHMNTDHFLTAIPLIQAISAADLEVRVVEYLVD
ncbi:antibiotic biosynthesis monooxygenase [Psittacicella hinzii]|uniref:Antibiotic biosynthesis monooxygenase n=1 Tax=Psittacicella hinzii TaxID=2028575 RepID=A0A3A1Y3X3_9GAMM|nr:putative quinol monooxygenase [Psittacicella hinzii]RIY32265.1 antibiotic biosynthesis monooxygenase [Psittacicella hinzii]